MIDDALLLRQFAAGNSEAAFRELVARRIDFVYGVALRQVGGDAHLAQEVAQNVFLDLARKARTLAARPSLTGWLYTSVRFAAAKALRSRARRLTHETEAHSMHEILSAAGPSAASDADWRALRPVLDAAMHELNETEREALLLRFFEGRSFTEVGGTIGLNENTARMRVERALEKLHARLARRGITSTAAALGVALANQPTVAAPAGLLPTLLKSALAGTSLAHAGPLATRATRPALDFMTKLKLASFAAVALVAVGGGTYLVANQNADTRTSVAVSAAHAELAGLRAENEQLKTQVVRLQTAALAAATPSPGAEPSVLGELRALAAASRKKLIPPMGTLLKLRKGQLSPAFVTLFAPSAEDKAALEHELGAIYEKLDALAAANVVSSERLSADSFVVRLNLYPAEGGKLHDQLLATLARLLGPEKESALMALIGGNFDWVVGSGFGTAERNVTFQRQKAGPNGQFTVYSFSDRMQPLPNTSDHANTAATIVQDRSNFPEYFPSLAKLLPADF